VFHTICLVECYDINVTLLHAIVRHKITIVSVHVGGRVAKLFCVAGPSGFCMRARTERICVERGKERECGWVGAWERGGWGGWRRG